MICGLESVPVVCGINVRSQSDELEPSRTKLEEIMQKDSCAVTNPIGDIHPRLEVLLRSPRMHTWDVENCTSKVGICLHDGGSTGSIDCASVVIMLRMPRGR